MAKKNQKKPPNFLFTHKRNRVAVGKLILLHKTLRNVLSLQASRFFLVLFFTLYICTKINISPLNILTHEDYLGTVTDPLYSFNSNAPATRRPET